MKVFTTGELERADYIYSKAQVWHSLGENKKNNVNSDTRIQPMYLPHTTDGLPD